MVCILYHNKVDFKNKMGRSYRRTFLKNPSHPYLHRPQEAIESIVLLALNCFSAGKTVNKRVTGTCIYNSSS